MDQQSKSNFNSPPGPDCLATKQFIIKKFLCFIINLDLKEMLKILGQILLCYFGANQEQFIEVNRATINWREKNYLHVLWKKLIYALSTMLGSTYYTFICLVLQKYGYFLKQIIDLDFFLLSTLLVPQSFQTYIKQNAWISSGLKKWLYQKVETKSTKF